MHYTITFNPAVDLVMQVPVVNLGSLNRAMKDDYVAGGKGINMSTILNQMGVATTATGFVGGFSGSFIRQAMEAEGISEHFIEVDGITRVNVKIKSEEETEINAKGPEVSQEEFAALLEYLAEVLEEGDVVYLAGNAAPGLTHLHYRQVAELCLDKGIRFVLDSNKDLLTQSLPYKPFLIKPNRDELEEIVNTDLVSVEAIIDAAMSLQNRGARNVIVSLGGDGALLVTEDGQAFQSGIPEGEVINSVGAGDSMVAGFMAHFDKTGDYAESLQMGAACGSATAYSVGIAKRDLIDRLFQEIEVKNIK